VKETDATPADPRNVPATEVGAMASAPSTGVSLIFDRMKVHFKNRYRVTISQRRRGTLRGVLTWGGRRDLLNGGRQDHSRRLEHLATGPLDLAPQQEPLPVLHQKVRRNWRRKVSATGRKGLSAAQRWAIVVVAVVLVWAYAPNLCELGQTWSRDPNYSHGWLVVPVALLILWQRRTGLDDVRIAPRWWGWGALAAVLATRAFFHERGDEWRETATLLPALACLGAIQEQVPSFP
jgi:Transmembrane exosortase (Exosortase_EpsH)